MMFDNDIMEYIFIVAVSTTLLAVLSVALSYISLLNYKRTNKTVKTIIDRKLKNIESLFEEKLNNIANAQAKLEGAYTLINGKNYKQALELLQVADEIYSGLFNLHNTLGYVYFELGHYESAELEFKRAINLRPNDVAGYNDISRVYAMIGDLKHSLDYLEQALKIESSKVLSGVGSDPAYKKLRENEAYNYRLEKLLNKYR